MTHQPPHDSPDDPAQDSAWQRDVREGSLSKRHYLLMQAAALGQTTRLAFIHAQDKTVCSDTGVMNNALRAATHAGHLNAVKWLLRQGTTDIRERSHCLVIAINKDDGDCADALLRYDIDLKIAQGMTAPSTLLSHAICNRKTKAAKALLLHGFDPFGATPTGQPLTGRMRDLGQPILTELTNRLWLKNVDTIAADFASKTPLSELQKVWQDHRGLTGYQLCAYNGQIDILLARLTENGRKLTTSDLITATPKHPQTILFILGQRGQLNKVFKPELWQHDAAAMRAVLPYVPAAFRAQVDLGAIAFAERQKRLKTRAATGTRPRLPKK